MSTPISRTIEATTYKLTADSSELLSWFQREDALLEYVPAQGWSIDQILEHITLTNHFLLILIRKAAKKALEVAAETDWQDDLAGYEYNLDRLDVIANNRSFTWTRPAHMEPTGQTPREEVKRKLQAQVDECLRILSELRHGEGILCTTMMSVGNLGKIDVYQYLYFLGLHMSRHLEQIRRVEAEFAL